MIICRLHINLWLLCLSLIVKIKIVLISFLFQGIFKKLFFHLWFFLVWLLISLVKSNFELFLLACCFWLRRALTWIVIVVRWRVARRDLVSFLNLIDYFFKRWGRNQIPLSYSGWNWFHFKGLYYSILGLERPYHRASRFFLTNLAHGDFINIVNFYCKIFGCIACCIIEILYFSSKFRHLWLRFALTLRFFRQIFNMENRRWRHILQIFHSTNAS